MQNKVKLPIKLFEDSVIKRSLYILFPNGDFEILEENNYWVISWNNQNITSETLKSTILETEIQINTEAKFHKIRNMLVAQALEPYQNVSDLLKILNEE